jgi:C4-dicarboxylate transporter DctM subunit
MGILSLDPITLGGLGIAMLFVLLALGIHIGFALMIASAIGLAVVAGFQPMTEMVINSFYHKISNPTLITLPLFILMGHLASGGGISRDIYESLSLWLGKFRSGLGIATVVGCAAFGTVCGASVVASAVFSKISAPQMRRQGYDKSLAYAISSASGAIGMLIPPSILAIVYGTLSGISIGKVLMAGVAPGILVTIAFSLTIIFMGKIRPEYIKRGATNYSASWTDRIKSLKSWWTVTIVALSIFGGMYGGIFSPSEAASVAAFLIGIIFLIRMFNGDRNKRKQDFQELIRCLGDTAITSALIFFIFGSATVFSQFIVLTGLTTRISELVIGANLSPTVIVILFTIIFLILGMFLDGISILCITIPVFNPIISAAGIDAIWYATIVILSVEVGLITPPVGLNLFAAKGVAEPDVSLEDIVRGIWPFVLAMVACVAILFVFPDIGTFLPRLVD